jgi:hypothetical protein
MPNNNLKRESKIWDVVDVQRAVAAVQQATGCRVDAEITAPVAQAAVTS